MRTWAFSFLLIISTFVLFPFVSSASETRVEATGGLGTILDDETTDLNLFLDGNPAGLIYLNTKDRFDLSGELSYSAHEGPGGGYHSTTLATLPDPSARDLSYGGLMLFPDPNWAFQVSAQALYQERLPMTHTSFDYGNQSRYLGVFRGSYAASFAVFGVEFTQFQTDNSYDPGSYDFNDQILSGSSAGGSSRLRFGIATTFPEHYTEDQTRFQAGFYWEAQLGASNEERDFQMDALSPPSFSVTQVWSTRDSRTWGGEFSVEVPGTFKAMLDVHLMDSSVDMVQTSSVPVTLEPDYPFPPYQAEDLILDGKFRWTLPFQDPENLKLGGFLSYFSNGHDSFDSSGHPGWEAGLGVGLDSPRDHFMGLQWTETRVPAGQDNDQLTFGGEKWVSSTWALRLGITGGISNFNGSSPDTLTTLIDMGTGFVEAFGRLDFRFRVGQAINMSNSSDTTGIVGAQVAGTLFL